VLRVLHFIEGLKGRMDLIRRALHAYLRHAGEQEVAALLSAG
jgi:hypothetical protein